LDQILNGGLWPYLFLHMAAIRTGPSGKIDEDGFMLLLRQLNGFFEIIDQVEIPMIDAVIPGRRDPAKKRQLGIFRVSDSGCQVEADGYKEQPCDLPACRQSGRR